MKKTEKKTNIKEGEVTTKEVKVKKGIFAWFAYNKPFIIAVLIIMAAFLSGYFIKNSLIAATVNGKTIWRYSLVRQLEKYYGANMLNTSIEQELIKQEAKNKKIEITKEEVAAKIKEIETSMASSGQTLDEALKESGMTRKDLEENYRLNLLIEKILSERIQVTDEEVQKYIDDNSESFPEGTDMESVKTIIVEQLKQQKMSTEYQSFINELKEKADIKTVAKY
jgi:foldase protein PrsA